MPPQHNTEIYYTTLHNTPILLHHAVLYNHKRNTDTTRCSTEYTKRYYTKLCYSTIKFYVIKSCTICTSDRPIGGHRLTAPSFTMPASGRGAL